MEKKNLKELSAKELAIELLGTANTMTAIIATEIEKLPNGATTDTISSVMDNNNSMAEIEAYAEKIENELGERD